MIVFALAGWAHGAPLDAPADPMSDYPARPEWFLYPLYELRKFFHGSGEFWGTTMLPAAAGGFLVLLPWIDAPSRPRIVFVGLPVLVIFGGAVGLGVMAAQHDAHDRDYAKSRAKADALATAVVALARQGIPPGGPLELLRRDPELHGRALFERHCASCHVLDGLGDAEKASASKLDGWGTAAWIERMIHDPDAPEFFGRGPYREEMPSVDVRPAKKPANEPFKPMLPSPAERHAVALFLESLGDEPGDPPRPAAEEAARKTGEKIVSERCTSCHLYKGDGDDEGSGIAPELAGYGSIAWTRAQVANPASAQTYRDKALDPQLKKHMPRFDRDLTPFDLDILARWTRSHSRH
jgi:ubiquinol-cytochrome c reductase cytochrome b subunit